MRVTPVMPAILFGVVGVLACREPRAAGPEGMLAQYRLGEAPAWRVRLPETLREISGLAVTGDGRVFAHGDEEATVHQLDPRSGAIRKRFTLAARGDEPDLGKKSKDADRVAGDFEGIEIVGDRFYLVTSNGVLLEFAEGEDGARVPYTAHRTGLDEICEVEGLAQDAGGDALLLLCKSMRDKTDRQRVVVYAWSVGARRLESSPRLDLPWSALASATGGRGFNGSALALVPGSGALALVAGPQRLYAEVTAGGVVLAGGALPREVHPQPESIAFLPDGTLLVASEGGKGDGTLSGYRRR